MFEQVHSHSKIIHLILLGIVLLGILDENVAFRTDSCQPCRCESSPPHFTVDCSSLALQTPPAGLPTNLTTLLLNDNSLRHINRTYFEQFPNIEYLSMADNVYLGLENVTESFFGLRKSNISIINATNVVEEYSYKKGCQRINSNFTLYLQNTSLKALYLDNNRILFIEPGMFKYVPEYLEIWSMRKSRLVIGPEFLIEGFHLKNLRKFDLSERNFEENIQSSETHILEEFNQLAWGNLRKRRIRQVSNYGITTISLPPKLEELIVDSCSFKTTMPELKFQKNNIKRISLRHNIIDPITGPIYGLTELEELDLSYCNCRSINRQLSLDIPAPKLRRLYFKGNYLDLSQHEYMFNYWTQLTMLDLSYNKISIVPNLVFEKLLLLEKLHLRGNIISHVSMKLIHLINLLVLDLRDNQVVFLSENTTSQLDSIRKVSNLTLDLTKNPIKCSCVPSSLHFVRWLFNTNVNIVQKSTLTCSTDDNTGTRKIIKTYLSELESRCESPTRYYGLALGASVGVTGCMSFIIMGIAYRYRYKIAYFYFIGRRRFHRNAEVDDEYNKLHEFNAYIAYADDDRDFAVHIFRDKLERQRQLNLCFRDRDFLPGDVIAEGIVSAIQKSRHVVLVLSPNFLKSGWRRYEFEMAQCEGIERKQSMVVLVKYKDFPLNDAPKDMLRMMHTETYLEFPDSEEDQQTFWETLRDTLSEG